MFNVRDNKAPGLDGCTSTLSKEAWKIVGAYVFLAIKKFFITGKLLGEMNPTLISLVPKFKFHKGYKELRLAHLYFDDDLLEVCHGDVETVRIVKDTMLEFSLWNHP
ncbi:hypothetical protein Tco_1001468 [Tanacetum coccineum]